MKKHDNKLVVEFHDQLLKEVSTAARGDLDITPENIIFDRDRAHQVAVFTDESIQEVENNPARLKVGWLLESPDYKELEYKRMSNRKTYNVFDLIYTFDKKLLRKSSKFHFLPVGGSWIYERDWKIYPKSKNVSIIASKKDFLEGHKVRHKAIALYRNMIDGVHGRGYNEFDYKKDVLKDYRYSITIENCRRDYYFTEKIIDCFLTGVVPIYWGCPSIEKFFNKDGIITFKNMRQLKKILNNVSQEDYEKRRKAIEDNFRRAQSYVMPEDSLARMIRQEYDAQGILKNPKGK